MSIVLGCVATADVVAAEPGIYLAGPFNYYGFSGSTFTDKWQLSSEDGTVYTGTFTIPQDKLIFNIVDYKGEEKQIIYGSHVREGSRTPIEFVEVDGLYTAELESLGAGDWAFEDWIGGDVTFSIDFSTTNPIITVTTAINPSTDESGVALTPADAVQGDLYTPGGLRVDAKAAAPGLYIRDNKLIIIK